MTSIAFLGDIMPGGVKSINLNNYIDKNLKSFLNDFDLRVGTLETAIGDDFGFDNYKVESDIYDIVYCKDKDIEKLTDLNINIVSLANNHIFDLDIDGFKNTVHQLDKAGVQYCGAGMNIEEASKPVLLEINGQKLAFLAYCKHLGWSSKMRVATENTPGINPLIDTNVIKDISYYKNMGYKVCLLLHWGNEHTIWPTNKDRIRAKSFIKAGADIIVGSHAHHVQPLYRKRKEAVYFNLGNFFFPDRYINKPRVTYYPSKKKGEDIEAYPIITDFRKVEEPTLKLWKETARYGMIGDVQLSDSKTVTKKHLTRLSKNNVVQFANKRVAHKINTKLSFITLFLHLPFYPFIIFCKRAFNYIIRKLK